MNLQENNCQCRPACVCPQRAIGFFVLLFAIALGLIFGAIYAEQIFSALAAVIVFAATMLAVIIGLLIYGRCRNCWLNGDNSY